MSAIIDGLNTYLSKTSNEQFEKDLLELNKWNKNMKVYIVTSGEYDDYCIERVFSTREKAKEYIECFGGDCYIEEYDLDEPIEHKERIWCAMFDGYEIVICSASYYGKVDSLLVYCNNVKIDLYFMADCKTKALEIAKERIDNILKNKDGKYSMAFIKGMDNILMDYNTGEIIG